MAIASERRFPVLLMLCLAFSACSTLRTDGIKSPSQALPASFDTAPGRYIHGELAAHPNQSGFRLVTMGPNALLSRVVLTDHAASSIDLQYYIFENDATGKLVAQHLLAAADRGVRVRLLVDDINSDGKDRLLAALDAHEKIEVRVFNPFRTRSPSLPSRIAQFLLEGSRLNRRMHNKSFIVDGNVAVVGGRNIGDPYFGAGDNANFRDLDLIAIGPVVNEAARAFDDYWNSDSAYPVTAFRDMHASAADLARMRTTLAHDARQFAQSDYAQAALDALPDGGPTADRFGNWFWGQAELVADAPEKVEIHRDVPSMRIGPKVKTILDAANRQVLLITPYFVPGDSGVHYLASLTQRGVRVDVLTNSLASNDETAAQAGYTNHRQALLAAGVHLFEMRPSATTGSPEITVRGKSAGASLHAKAAVVDDRYAFVGSMNMDQRSKLLNTEMGVIVDCPDLAAAIAKMFATASSPANAYRVDLQSGHATWTTEVDGQPKVFTSEPDSTWQRRFILHVLRVLPIEGLL